MTGHMAHQGVGVLSSGVIEAAARRLAEVHGLPPRRAARLVLLSVPMDDVLELARYVRTPAGVRRYGKPIGSLITEKGPGRRKPGGQQDPTRPVKTGADYVRAATERRRKLERGAEYAVDRLSRMGKRNQASALQRLTTPQLNAVDREHRRRLDLIGAPRARAPYEQSHAAVRAELERRRTAALRGLSDEALQQRMERAVARNRLGEFERLAGEADRRDTERQKARAARERAREKRQARQDARADRVGELIEQGVDEVEAQAEVYGGDPDRFRRQRAIRELRAAGYSGRTFDELARESFREHVDRELARAEDATRGRLLRRATESANARHLASGRQITPRQLFTSNEAVARRHASEELRAYWDRHGRTTYAEWRAELLGDTTRARRYRSQRDVFVASVDSTTDTTDTTAAYTDSTADAPPWVVELARRARTTAHASA